MEDRPRNPLRLLAPIALAAFALAVVVVVTSADVSDGGDPTSARQSEERDLGDAAEEEQAEAGGDGDAGDDERLPDDVYVVKEGDTLGAIAQRVGISVEQLQELNPDLDPQALVSGQQIKLRE